MKEDLTRALETSNIMVTGDLLHVSWLQSLNVICLMSPVVLVWKMSKLQPKLIFFEKCESQMRKGDDMLNFLLKHLNLLLDFKWRWVFSDVEVVGLASEKYETSENNFHI
ncbi:hypothetical protein Scep_022598 [Stephania cephalantha]|uniref:Uncharacterized protein n=1 Tax=Stephania cephalantha TaxID=152367 RepID=A0AAP0F6I4_9MAGN